MSATAWRRRVEQPAWRLDRKAADADFAESLADFVDSLTGELDALDQAVGWTGKASTASRLLEQLLGPEGRRTAWPEHERAAAERVESALTRLQQLDDIEPEPTTASFVRAVASELEIVDGRVGRFGEGVVFGPLAMAAGLDLDAVFVVGMAEGTCPAPRREDPLLTDEDREASNGELIRREERLHEQHRHYLAALAAGGDQRVLLFPRGNLRGGRDRLPSRWLLQTASALAGARVHSSAFAEQDSSVVTEIASFARGLVTAPTAASAAERDLAVMATHASEGGDPALHPVTPPALRRALEGIAARRSADFTEWDGNLAGQPVPSPTDGVVVSASRAPDLGPVPAALLLRLRAEAGRSGRPRDADLDRRRRPWHPRPRESWSCSSARSSTGRRAHRRRPRPGPMPTGTGSTPSPTRSSTASSRKARPGGRCSGVWNVSSCSPISTSSSSRDNAYRSAFGATPVQVELPFGYEPAAPADPRRR